MGPGGVGGAQRTVVCVCGWRENERDESARSDFGGNRYVITKKSTLVCIRTTKALLFNPDPLVNLFSLAGSSSLIRFLPLARCRAERRSRGQYEQSQSRKTRVPFFSLFRAETATTKRQKRPLFLTYSQMPLIIRLQISRYASALLLLLRRLLALPELLGVLLRSDPDRPGQRVGLRSVFEGGEDLVLRAGEGRSASVREKKKDEGRKAKTHLLVRDGRTNTHRSLGLVDEGVELRRVWVVALELQSCVEKSQNGESKERGRMGTHGVDLLVVALGSADAKLRRVVRVDEAELVPVGVNFEFSPVPPIPRKSQFCTPGSVGHETTPPALGKEGGRRKGRKNG